VKIQPLYSAILTPKFTKVIGLVMNEVMVMIFLTSLKNKVRSKRFDLINFSGSNCFVVE